MRKGGKGKEREMVEVLPTVTLVMRQTWYISLFLFPFSRSLLYSPTPLSHTPLLSTFPISPFLHTY